MFTYGPIAQLDRASDFILDGDACANLYIEFELAVCANPDGKHLPNEWLQYPRNVDGVNGVHFIGAVVCFNAKGGTWESIKST